MSNAAERIASVVPTYVDVAVRTAHHDEFDLLMRVRRYEAIRMSQVVRMLADTKAQHATFLPKDEARHVEFIDLALPKRDTDKPETVIVPSAKHVRFKSDVELNAKSIPCKFDHIEYRVDGENRLYLAVGHEDCGPYWNESIGFVAYINDLLRHFDYKTLKDYR